MRNVYDFASPTLQSGVDSSKKLRGVPVPPVLVAGEEWGNESLRDALVRWSRTGIACEPIGPTEAMMPAAPPVVGEGEGKLSVAGQQAEGSQHIAGESRVIQLRRSARPASLTQHPPTGSALAGSAYSQQEQEAGAVAFCRIQGLSLDLA